MVSEKYAGVVFHGCFDMVMVIYIYVCDKADSICMCFAVCSVVIFLHHAQIEIYTQFNGGKKGEQKENHLRCCALSIISY